MLLSYDRDFLILVYIASHVLNMGVNALISAMAYSMMAGMVETGVGRYPDESLTPPGFGIDTERPERGPGLPPGLLSRSSNALRLISALTTPSSKSKPPTTNEVSRLCESSESLGITEGIEGTTS